MEKLFVFVRFDGFTNFWSDSVGYVITHLTRRTFVNTYVEKGEDLKEDNDE